MNILMGVIWLQVTTPVRIATNYLTTTSVILFKCLLLFNLPSEAKGHTGDVRMPQVPDPCSSVFHKNGTITTMSTDAI